MSYGAIRNPKSTSPSVADPVIKAILDNALIRVVLSCRESLAATRFSKIKTNWNYTNVH
jgi:hypothetical protein